MLHCRYSMSKFTEMLVLLFIQFYLKVFPIATVSLFCKNLLLSILNQYFMKGNIFVQSWLIWATFYFSLIKFPFFKGCEECSYKTVSKNAEAAILKCSSEAVAQRCSVKKMFLEILQTSQESTCAKVSLLIKLQTKISNFI